jgi:probable rRNA maturation factor
MQVHIHKQTNSLEINSTQVEGITKAVLTEENILCDEISIYFVDEEEICRLHERFFNDPSRTDCITLPMDKEADATGYRVLGEVFICTDVACSYARDHDLDPYEEASLYLVHGLLHLLGFDDISDEDIQIMRQAESKHMSLLKEKNLVLH